MGIDRLLSLSATLSAHFEKFTNLTPLEKNGLAQLPLPATPQLMDSATLSAHFEKFTNLTPLEKMDSPNFPYLPPLN